MPNIAEALIVVPMIEPKQATITTEAPKVEKTAASSEEEVKRQKEKLLWEVLSQQQKIIDEQTNLHQQNTHIATDPVPLATPHPRLSKALVHEKYDKAKQDEEVKVMKTMTHLNRLVKFQCLPVACTLYCVVWHLCC